MKTNGIEFLRDLIEWANHRPEFLNQEKTVKELINDFTEATSPDPNHYDDHGRSCIGY